VKERCVASFAARIEYLPCGHSLEARESNLSSANEKRQSRRLLTPKTEERARVADSYPRILVLRLD
jgi:hypothetical protein